MSITREEYKRMGATSRRNVGRGPGPLVPRYLVAYMPPGKGICEAGNVLDFGCGVDAVQVEELRDRGYEVMGYEWAPEERDLSPRARKYRAAVEARLINPHALTPPRTYRTVLASNVLNVQPSWSALLGTLRQLKQAVGEHGQLIANLASDPRFIWSRGAKGRNELEAVLREHFCGVELRPVPGSKEKVFVCSGPLFLAPEQELAMLRRLADRGVLPGID